MSLFQIRAASLEDPSADEFRANPSLRTTSSFFVGWVFIVSLIYLAESPAARFLRRRVSAGVELILPKPTKTPEEVENNNEEESRLRQWIVDTLLGDDDTNADPLNLAFVLTLFAAVGSLSMFGSLLTFRSPGMGDDALCAFVVAWGAMSAQAMRLVGLTRVSLDLKALYIRRWELYIMWTFLLASLVLMFVSNAISSGVLVSVPELQDIGLCYRRHFVTTAVIATVFNLVLEIYATGRFITLLVPSFLQTKDKIHALLDIRIARALSFLLMELLTMVPNARFITIPADFIPFSISALIVLITFNHNEARALARLSRTDSIPSTTMLNLGRTPSTATYSYPPSRRTTLRTSIPPPPVPRKTLSNGYIKYNQRLRQSLGMHPYSAASLKRRDYTEKIETPIYPPSSALTWTSADARSIQEAKIELAFRETTFRSNSPARTPELIEGGGKRDGDESGATPRLNQTSRGMFPAQSMYVDEHGEVYANVQPDAFPLPPPIFPLPPPRSPGSTPPKLRIQTGATLTAKGASGSGNRADQTPDQVSKWSPSNDSNDSKETQKPLSSVPSMVYGSDIVRASGSRNLLDNARSSRQTPKTRGSSEDDFVDDYASYQSMDPPDRSARSTIFTITPLPSAMSPSSRLSMRTFFQDPVPGEDEDGLSVVEEEGGGISAVGGRRYSFGIRSKGKGKERERQSITRKMSRMSSTRRSRRTNSMDGATTTPVRTAGTTGEGGQWSTVPIMLVVDKIPTSPISAPAFGTGPLSPGLLSPPPFAATGVGRGVSSAVRGTERTRARLMPRGPRNPEHESAFSPEETLPRGYLVSPTESKRD